jgi:hypothetical protein
MDGLNCQIGVNDYSGTPGSIKKIRRAILIFPEKHFNFIKSFDITSFVIL